ncbi:MAG: hypothetical protein ABH873_04450 [Candidatus Firestonebacteria bacterium]
MVIQKLSEKYPLTCREIYKEIKNKKQSTYQGTHKTVIQLLKEGVLEKRGKKYTLNLKWVHEKKNFYERTIEKYAGKNKLNIETLKKGEIQTLVFNCPAEMGYWLIKAFNKILKNKSKRNSLSQFKWVWPGIAVSDKEYPALKRMEQYGNFISTTEKKTKLDKILTQYYRSLGTKKFAYNIPLEEGLERYVIEDYVFKIIWTGASNKKRRKIYEETPDVDKALAKLYTYAFRTDDNIKIIIIYNQELANNIRKQVKRQLGFK